MEAEICEEKNKMVEAVARQLASTVECQYALPLRKDIRNGAPAGKPVVPVPLRSSLLACLWGGIQPQKTLFIHS